MGSGGVCECVDLLEKHVMDYPTEQKKLVHICTVCLSLFQTRMQSAGRP